MHFSTPSGRHNLGVPTGDVDEHGDALTAREARLREAIGEHIADDVDREDQLALTRQLLRAAGIAA